MIQFNPVFVEFYNASHSYRTQNNVGFIHLGLHVPRHSSSSKALTVLMKSSPRPSGLFSSSLLSSFSSHLSFLSPPNNLTHPLHLDEMLTPKVRPKIHNLPRAQSNKHTHSENSKPLNPLIRTLICISELLLSSPQIIHLSNNLANRLLNTAKLRFNGLELLVSGNGAPVLCVGANINVELDVARLDVGRVCARVGVGEAHVEG